MKTVVCILDQGDLSVGIPPINIEISANVSLLDGCDKTGREEVRTRLKELFDELFDMIGRVDVTFEDECVDCGRLLTICKNHECCKEEL